MHIASEILNVQISIVDKILMDVQYSISECDQNLKTWVKQ